MSNSGLVLIKSKGQIVPEGLITKIIPAFPNFMGTVMVDGVDLSVAAYDDVPKLADFMSEQERHRETTVVFYFGKTADGKAFTEESVQPFALLADADDKCVLAAVAEGEFFTFNKPGSTHSDEYHMNDEFLKPTMAEILDACNGDLAAMMDKIRDPAGLKHKSLLMGMINRGVIVLFSADGEIIKIEKGNDGMRMEEPWGYVSNCLGYVEGSSKDVVIDKPKQSVVRRVIAAVTPAGKTTIASENAKVADTKLAEALKEEKHTVPAPDYFALKEQAKKIYIQCPQELITKGDRRDWHRMWTVLLPNGEPPSKYKDHPGPWCEANQNFLDVRDKKIDWKTLPLPAIHMSVTPIIKPSTKSALTQLINSGAVQAILTKAKVLNPDDLTNRSVATFSAQMGISFEDTYQWDREIKLKFIEKAISEKDLMPIILAWEEAQDECMRLTVGVTAPAADTNTKVEEKKEIVPDALKPNVKKEVEAKPSAPAATPTGSFGAGRRVVRKVA